MSRRVMPRRGQTDHALWGAVEFQECGEQHSNLPFGHFQGELVSRIPGAG